MLCNEVMKRPVSCVSEMATVQQAARLMKDQNIGFLPVTDGDGRVLGTITDRDLAIRVLANGVSEKTRISDVMTADIVSCRPEEELSRATSLMARGRKSRIVCVDGRGRLVGVISLSDVVRRDDADDALRTIRAVTDREVRA